MNIDEEIKNTFSRYEYLDHKNATEFNFDLIHIRDSGEFAYPDGYYDAKIIIVELYNTRTNKAIKLNHFIDGVDFSGAYVLFTRIFLDGSTVIKLKGEHDLLGVNQCLFVRSI